MKKTFFFAMLTAFLFIGAGCDLKEESNSKPAEDTANSQELTTEVKIEDIKTEPNEEENGLKLSGEALTTGSVKLNWEVAEELKKEAEGYGLTLGNDPDPEYPGRYWYQRGPAHFEKIWSGLPSGTKHFRVCILKNNKCTDYSNDLELEIK